MPINTTKRGLPKPESGDNVLEYSAGTIAGGGLHTALNTLDDVILDSDVTAKGQIFVADAAGSVTVLDPGANGTVLIADSTVPEGVKWDTAPATTIPPSPINAPAVSWQPSGTGASLVLVNGGYELQVADGAGDAGGFLKGLSVPERYAGASIRLVSKWRVTGATSQSMRLSFVADTVADDADPSADPTTSRQDSTVTSSTVAAGVVTTTLTWSTSLPTAGRLLNVGLLRKRDHAGDTSASIFRHLGSRLEFSA